MPEALINTIDFKLKNLFYMTLCAKPHLPVHDKQLRRSAEALKKQVPICIQEAEVGNQGHGITAVKEVEYGIWVGSLEG